MTKNTKHIPIRGRSFDIEFKYKDETYQVKADLPVGPEPFGSDYDNYTGRRHMYTLKHRKNEDEVYCWDVSKKPNDDMDPGFAQAMGKAIDRYYS